MRFICVRNALRELIPELQRAVQRGRDELVFVDTSDACDIILMGCSRLEVSLTDNHIFVHIGFHLLHGFCLLGFFPSVYRCWLYCLHHILNQINFK